MTVERGTSYTQLQSGRFGVGEPILAGDTSDIAKNQGYAFELLTGRDVTAPSTTAAGTVVGHNHSEAGNRIFRMLAHAEFGTSYKWASDGDATYEVYQYPITYATNGSTTAGEIDNAMSFVIDVPRGHAGKEHMLWMHTHGTDPRFRATLRDSSLAVVTGYERVPLQPWTAMGGNATAIWSASGLAPSAVYGFVFTPASAGLYAFQMDTTIAAVEELRHITCVGVMPTWRPADQNAYVFQMPATGSNVVTVGDPDNSNAWHPIDSNLTASDSPLHAATLTLMGHNQNYLFEHSTGKPAPGNATLTLSRGHNHRGVSDTDATARLDGDEIEYPHLCLIWGAAIAETSFTDNLWGNRSRAVRPTDTGAARTFAKGRIYLPQSLKVNASGSNLSNLKVAVLVDVDGDKTEQIDVTVQLGSTTKTFRSALSGNGLQLLVTPTSGTNNFAYTAGAKNTFECSATMNALSGTPTGYVCSVLAYIDP